MLGFSYALCLCRKGREIKFITATLELVIPFRRYLHSWSYTFRYTVQTVHAGKQAAPCFFSKSLTYPLSATVETDFEVV